MYYSERFVYIVGSRMEVSLFSFSSGRLSVLLSFFCCFFRVDRARVLCYRERALVMILTLSFRPDGGAIGRRCLFDYKTIPSPDRWPGLMAWARFPFASAWCSLSLVFRSSCAVSHRTVIIFRSVRRSTVAAYFKFQHPSKYRIGTPVC